MKANYQTYTIGDLCTSLNGLWKGKKEPFVNVGVIRNANFTKDFKLDYSNIEFIDVEQRSFEKRNLQDGDLIIEKSGGSEKNPVGRAVLYEGESGKYSYSNFTSVLRINDKKQLSSKYLYNFILYRYKEGDMAGMQSHSTGIHNLDYDKYLAITIPVPSLSEQERIVKQLDDAFAKIDALKENAQKGLQAVKDLWQATLKEELKPKEGWKKSSLGESCISIKDGSHNPPKGVEYSDFLMLSSRNIQNGYLDTKDVRYLSQDDFEIENARTKAEKGQVLLTIVGTIGRTCVLTGTEGNITFQRSVSVITPKELINSYYLMYYFLSINEILNEKANGAAQKGIYLKQLSNLEIIIPSIREQEYLVKKLDCLSEKCKQMQFQYEQELTEYDALKQSILRKAFSGEL